MTSGKVVKGKCSNISEYLAQHSHNKKKLLRAKQQY